MVARALWRSEARMVVPWSETLHFYNMEYKIVKKIRQNTTWIEADILGMNHTPNRYNALAPAIVYVSNDVTIPFNSVTSQKHKERYFARMWNRFEIFMYMGSYMYVR